MTLDFKQYVRAIHPVSWIYKHIIDADFAGPVLAFKVRSSEFGPFVGQKGFHVKFLDSVMRRLIGVGVRAIEVEDRKERKK